MKSAEPIRILINHLGYDCSGPKQVVVTTPQPLTVQQLELRRAGESQLLMTCPLELHGTVDQWHTGLTYSADFSQLTEAGEYYLALAGSEPQEQVASSVFSLADGLLLSRTLSDVLHYFKSQRCSGSFDRADTQVPLHGSDERVDVHGGWYDASGDVSKYLSHLAFSNYLSPQQTPMVIWCLLHSLEQLAELPEVADFTRRRMLDEALHGAEFLLRMQHGDGSFYMTVFDVWSKDTAQREVCRYAHQSGERYGDFRAGFRHGAGVAIAALAQASRFETDHQQSDSFLAAAERGYWHLERHNADYLDDGKENIIDEYCALLACCELYRATQQAFYREQARTWCGRLQARQMSDGQQRHFWSADESGERPYYHAAEAGLPAISLMQYLSIETDSRLRRGALQVLRQSLAFELAVTAEVENPFGYPRQYVCSADMVTGERGPKQSAFFIPHNNESGYWWQGENARLASLSAMASMAASLPEVLSDSGRSGSKEDGVELAQLQRYAQQGLSWILGLNPFDVCMLDGHGRNNPDYLPELGFFNARGGVCNGITAGFENEKDIAFRPQPQQQDMMQNWRWGEQWIPHGAWYLLAASLQRVHLARQPAKH